MSVVGEACLLSRNASGEISDQGFVFEAVYEVNVDSINDGPGVALGASGLPALGDDWEHGNDGTVTAYLRRMVARRSQIALKWHVSCYYESPTVNSALQEEFKDQFGDPVTDPADVPLRIVPTFERQVEVVEKAKFIDYVDIDGNSIAVADATLDKNKVMVPQNSAFIPFLPALEDEYSRLVLLCTRWFSEWDPAIGDNLDKVNESPYALVGEDAFGYYFEDVYQAREMLYRDATAELSVRSDYKVLYRVTFEIAIKRGGWYRDVLDRGRHRVGFAVGQQPDGYGGTFGNDWVEGASSAVEIRTPAGTKITEPVPLDGRGQPLEIPNPDNQVYLRWLTKEEFDISVLFE